jgi:L-ascorbate metabolism protein UlaG (beta-lactamase superfamily)
VTISHDAPGHNAAGMVKKAQYFLERPGEYEIGGVFLTGVATYNKKAEGDAVRRNLIWIYSFEDYTVAHLGDLDHVPAQSEVEALGPIDVLLIPVGGGRALNAGQAGEVISLIEPAIAIPMHYATPQSQIELEPLDKFLKEMGVSSVEEIETLKVTAGALSEETQVVVLKPQV